MLCYISNYSQNKDELWKHDLQYNQVKACHPSVSQYTVHMHTMHWFEPRVGAAVHFFIKNKKTSAQRHGKCRAMRKMRNNTDQRMMKAQRGGFQRKEERQREKDRERDVWQGGHEWSRKSCDVDAVEHEVSYREMRTDLYEEQERNESWSVWWWMPLRQLSLSLYLSVSLTWQFSLEYLGWFLSRIIKIIS